MGTIYDRNKYKLAIPEWCLPGDNVFSIRMASELGFDGIQIESGFPKTGFKLSHRWVLELYKETAKKYGVELISIAMNDLDYHGFRHGRGTEFGDIAYEGLDVCIDAAAVLDIPVIMAPSFLDNEIHTTEDFDHTVEALQYACDRAAVNGTIIATETAVPAETVKKLFDTVDRKNLKLFHDTENYMSFCGYNPMDHLPKVYPYMTNMIHVKDGIGRSGSSRCLGEGDSHFEEQIAFLKEVNYSGWFIFENYYNQLPMREMCEDPVDLVRKDLEKIKKELAK